MEMTKTEKALAEYYYSCRGKKIALERELMRETAVLQSKIDELADLMLDIENMLKKGDIEPVYEKFEKLEEVEE